MICSTFIFKALEHERWEELNVEGKTKQNDLQRFVNQTFNATSEQFDILEKDFREMIEYPTVNPWNGFADPFTFCVNSALTIGYGNFTPLTVGGRWFCIFFACLAVFLFLTLTLEYIKLNQDLLRLARHRYPRWGFCIKISISAFLILLFCVLIGVGLNVTEGWDFTEIVYFIVVSITTIGYGDLVPESANDGENEWYAIIVVFLIPFVIAEFTALFDKASMGSAEKMMELGEYFKSGIFDDDDDDEQKLIDEDKLGLIMDQKFREAIEEIEGVHGMKISTKKAIRLLLNVNLQKLKDEKDARTSRFSIGRSESSPSQPAKIVRLDTQQVFHKAHSIFSKSESKSNIELSQPERRDTADVFGTTLHEEPLGLEDPSSGNNGMF